jgi:hypothetical protein
MPDMEIKCEECSQQFTITTEQQAYYAETGYTLPSRCEACTDKRQQARAAEKASRRPKKKRRW